MLNYYFILRIFNSFFAVAQSFEKSLMRLFSARVFSLPVKTFSKWMHLIMIYIAKIKFDFAGKNYKIDGVRFTNLIDTLCWSGLEQQGQHVWQT